MRDLIVSPRPRWALFLLSFLSMCCAPMAHACDSYFGTTLTIPVVVVGGTTYTNVLVTVTLGDVKGVGSDIANPSVATTPDLYDPATGLLTIPCVTVGATTFTNVVATVTLGNVMSVGASHPSANIPTLIPVFPLPGVTVGQTPTYSQSVVFKVSPPSTYTYAIDSLAVGNGTPSSMTINMSGLLSGTPFVTGAADVNGYQIPKTYTFGVCAVDTWTKNTTTPCPQTSITVNPANVTVTMAGTGSGTVTPSPAGNSCGANCYSGFASGASLTLTATPAAGSIFTGWSGACSGGSCALSANGNMAVTATFTLHPTCSNGAADYPICTQPISSVSPSAVQLGTAGSCSGGRLTTSFQVAAASNVSWTAAGDTPAVGGGSTLVVSPRSGTGPGTITVTITVPPQLPSSSYSNCTLTYPMGTFDNVYVTFSDGSIVGVTVYWTFIGVT